MPYNDKQHVIMMLCNETQDEDIAGIAASAHCTRQLHTDICFSSRYVCCNAALDTRAMAPLWIDQREGSQMRYVTCSWKKCRELGKRQFHNLLEGKSCT